MLSPTLLLNLYSVVAQTIDMEQYNETETTIFPMGRLESIMQNPLLLKENRRLHLVSVLLDCMLLLASVILLPQIRRRNWSAHPQFTIWALGRLYVL